MYQRVVDKRYIWRTSESSVKRCSFTELTVPPRLDEFYFCRTFQNFSECEDQQQVQGMWLQVYLLVLLVSSTLCQREGPESSWEGPGETGWQDGHLLNLNIKKMNQPQQRQSALKRSPQGPRFALSLDVPTSILSVLIDLARNQDMHAKAAANAELMARIGRRK
ncbi:urocortin-3-like [Arapaima gigas]